MTSQPRKVKANRLLPGLILVSLGVHLLLLMHVAGIYRSSTLTCIELTIQDSAPPVNRSIPRPRVRHKAPKTTDVKKIHILAQDYAPAERIAPPDTMLPYSVMQEINVPELPEQQDQELVARYPHSITKSATANDYFTLVRLRIESRKQYPAYARSRHLEGRVTVRFVITKNGGVTSVMIVKRGRHGSLNRAAIKAVQDAAPFPKPPANLFHGPLHMEITIVFELT